MKGFIVGVIAAVLVLILGQSLFGIDPSFAELILVVVAFVVADIVGEIVEDGR